MCMHVHCLYKGHPKNDLYCVMWEVKPYTLIHYDYKYYYYTVLQQWLLLLLLHSCQVDGGSWHWHRSSITDNNRHCHYSGCVGVSSFRSSSPSSSVFHDRHQESLYQHKQQLQRRPLCHDDGGTRGGLPALRTTTTRDYHCLITQRVTVITPHLPTVL